MTNKDRNQNNKNVIAKLAVLTVAMFVFAIWVMPPLYDAFCEITGLNGKTKGPYQAVKNEVDTSREVMVQFVATNNESMPWDFKPSVSSIKVHPGQEITTTFVAHNRTHNAMTAQAIPSLVPFLAVEYFHKTECFCFHSQSLKAGEQAELPLRFFVDQSIPKQVKTITLSYTLFDITDNNPVAVN